MATVRLGRREKGSILALTAALGLALVVLGVGFFFFIMFMNAQKETKNAIDAGTLNVGKKALDEISVPVTNKAFWDVCSDPDDSSIIPDPSKLTVNLRRINRVWAEAMLYKINALAQKNEGQDNSGMSNASSALQSAEQTSDLLATRLKLQTEMYPFFKDLARQNNIRMIGNSASVKEIPGPNWQTSKMIEGTNKVAESNIMIGGNAGNNFFAPHGFTWKGSNVTNTRRSPAPANSNGMFFLKGYENLDFGGDSIWQVPFLFEDKPHMVSKGDFEKAKNNASGWSNAVPNAFSAEGVASQPGKPAEKGMAWVITNPRQTYKAAIPHSFVRLRVEKPKVNWQFVPFAVPITYFTDTMDGFTPKSMSSPPAPAGGPLCATVQAVSITVGLEYVALLATGVDGMVFLPPKAGSAENYIEQELVARCNEMITKVGETVTASEVHSALSNPLCSAALLSGLSQDFALYSPDGKSIRCLPIVSGVVADPQAPWLSLIANQTPDGSEKKKGESSISLPAAMPPFHPVIVPDPFCVENFGLGFGTMDKSLFWQPGTGVNGCLGKVRVQRETNVISIGICVPLI
ncbi:MAG: hypothetical protein DKT66_26955 [Candidatus Melainabacteria bacterium]|nr:MAG: hypothetical protein DKT66_26955 [Candidatus Melainabacteria bacterium]